MVTENRCRNFINHDIEITINNLTFTKIEDLLAGLLESKLLGSLQGCEGCALEDARVEGSESHEHIGLYFGCSY